MNVWYLKAAPGTLDVLIDFDPHTVGGGDLGKLMDVIGRRAAEGWQPLRAEAGPGSGASLAFVNTGGEPTCDAEAWAVIGPEVAADAEGLSIVAGDRTYYVINVVRTVDCLDIGNSKVLRSPLDGSVFEIVHAVVHAERLEGIMLFRLPESPKRVYATEAFKALVEAHGFRGLLFEGERSSFLAMAQALGQIAIP